MRISHVFENLDQCLTVSRTANAIATEVGKKKLLMLQRRQERGSIVGRSVGVCRSSIHYLENGPV